MSNLKRASTSSKIPNPSLQNAPPPLLKRGGHSAHTIPTFAPSPAVERLREASNPNSDKYKIDSQEIEMQSVLGKGAYGEVWKAKYHGTTVAVKKIIGLESSAVEEFVGEISVMVAMRPHSNICAFYGYCESPLSIVMEFLPGGSLESFIKTHTNIPTIKKLHWFKDIASGMYHLQLSKLVHKDLAARNVLIARDGSVKVSDFGLSRLSTSKSNTNSVLSEAKVGPLKWMAPESLREKKFSLKSDVWAFGVTSIEILTQKDPLPKYDPVQAATGICLGEISYCNEIPHDYLPEKITQMLVSCFEIDPNARPNFQEILDVLENNIPESGLNISATIIPSDNHSAESLPSPPQSNSAEENPNSSAQSQYGLTPAFVQNASTSHGVTGLKVASMSSGSLTTGPPAPRQGFQRSGSTPNNLGNRTSSNEMPDSERWEVRQDSKGRNYYVDHLLKTTTYTAPHHLQQNQQHTQSQQNQQFTQQSQQNQQYTQPPPQQYTQPPPQQYPLSQSAQPYPTHSYPPAQPYQTYTTPVAYQPYAPYYPPYAAPVAYPPQPYPFSHPYASYGPPPSGFEQRASNSSSSSSGSVSNNSAEKIQLPKNWEAKLDPQGRVYYVNHTTRQTSYDPPKV